MVIRLVTPLSILAIVFPACAGEMPSPSGPEAHSTSFDEDIAILEAGAPRKDLNCTLMPDQAFLGFDLKFHTGYEVWLPLGEIAGAGGTLSILFRVTAKGGNGWPVYFGEKLVVPPIADTRGGIHLSGTFDVGEGSYHVEWLMRDHRGRLCPASWDVLAPLPPQDSGIVVALPAQTVRPTEGERFQPEPPAQRTLGAPLLHLKILMNFAPRRPDLAALDPQDQVALISILRNLFRDPRVGKVSLVVFNIQQREVLYRQSASDQIDFPAIGKAVSELRLGTVDVRRLADQNGDVEFLSRLIKDEMAVCDGVDGLIFAGPKSLIDSSVSRKDLKEIGEPEFPVFYMNYTLDPQEVPWDDAIGRVVKSFRGRRYTVSTPSELWNSVTEAVARTAESKAPGRRADGRQNSSPGPVILAPGIGQAYAGSATPR